MKNLFTATALSLAALLGTQACFAEESSAFVAQSQAHQQQSAGAEQQVQSTHRSNTSQQG